MMEVSAILRVEEALGTVCRVIQALMGHTRDAVLFPLNVRIGVDGEVDLTACHSLSETRNPHLQNLTARVEESSPLRYIPPEAVRGELVEASDQYGVGCLLLYHITGTHPYALAATVSDVLYAIEALPLLSPSDPRLPAPVLQYISHLTHKDPQNRYRSLANAQVDAFRLIRHLQKGLVNVSLPLAPTAPLGTLVANTGLYGNNLAQRVLSETAADWNSLALKTRDFPQGVREKRVLVVSGPPGTGKTTAVREMLLRLENVGLFAAVETMEQHQSSNVTLTEILAKVLHHFSNTQRLSEADLASLAVDTLAEEGHKVPSIVALWERVGCETPESYEPLAAGGGVRTVHGIVRLLSRLALHEPFVLVFNDVQWADEALVTSFAEFSLAHAAFMVIFAYRSDCVHPDHPVTDLLAQLHVEAEVFLTHVHTDVLSEAELGEYFTDLFLLPYRGEKAVCRRLESGEAVPAGAEMVREMTRVIHSVTKGNLHIVQEYLQVLIDSGTLTYHAPGTWHVTPTLLRSSAIPSTLKELLQISLSQLTPAELAFLQVAAVLGTSWSPLVVIAILRHLYGEGLLTHFPRDVEGVGDVALRVLRSRFVVPTDEFTRPHFESRLSGAIQGLFKDERRELEVATATYEFVHDQIVHAIVNLISPQVLVAIRVAALRVLCAVSNLAKASTELSLIASLSTLCAGHVDQLRSVPHLPRHLLLSQRGLYESGSYKLSLAVGGILHALLSDGSRSSDLEALAFSAYECIALCKLNIGVHEFGEIQSLTETMLQQAKTWQEKYSCYWIRIRASNSASRHQDALASGLELLLQFGVPDLKSFDEIPPTAELGPLITDIHSRFEAIAFDLSRLPECGDLATRKVMGLWGLLGESAYYLGGDMRAIMYVTLISAREVLTHGLCGEAVVALAWYIIYLQTSELANARRLFLQVETLATRYPLQEVGGQWKVLFATLLKPVVAPIYPDCAQFFETAFSDCLQVGDVARATYNVIVANYLLAAGLPLSIVDNYLESMVRLCLSYNMAMSVTVVRPTEFAMASFRLKCEDRVWVSTKSLSERDFEREMQSSPAIMKIWHYQTRMLRFLLLNHREEMRCAMGKTAELAGSLLNLVVQYYAMFYYVLCAAELYIVGERDGLFPATGEEQEGDEVYSSPDMMAHARIAQFVSAIAHIGNPDNDFSIMAQILSGVTMACAYYKGGCVDKIASLDARHELDIAFERAYERKLFGFAVFAAMWSARLVNLTGQTRLLEAWESCLDDSLNMWEIAGFVHASDLIYRQGMSWTRGCAPRYARSSRGSSDKDVIVSSTTEGSEQASHPISLNSLLEMTEQLVMNKANPLDMLEPCLRSLQSLTPASRIVVLVNTAVLAIADPPSEDHGTTPFAQHQATSDPQRLRKMRSQHGSPRAGKSRVGRARILGPSPPTAPRTRNHTPDHLAEFHVIACLDIETDFWLSEGVMSTCASDINGRRMAPGGALSLGVKPDLPRANSFGISRSAFLHALATRDGQDGLVLINDIQQLSKASQDEYAVENDVRAVAVLRMKLGNGAECVLYLESQKFGAFGAFSGLLHVFGSLLGTSIHTSQLFQRQQTSLDLLQATQIAKSNFLGNVSHELRTPLNGILATSELLSSDVRGDSYAKERMQNILIDIGVSGDELLTVVSDVTNFLILSSCTVHHAPHVFELRAVIATAVVGQEVISDRATAHVVLEIGDTVPVVVNEDPCLLSVTLQHLLKLSLEASPPGHAVVCDVGRVPSHPQTPDGYCRLRISVTSNLQDPHVNLSSMGSGTNANMPLQCFELLLPHLFNPSKGQCSEGHIGESARQTIWFEFDTQPVAPAISDSAKQFTPTHPGQIAESTQTLIGASRCYLVQLLSTISHVDLEESRAAASGKTPLPARAVQGVWNGFQYRPELGLLSAGGVCSSGVRGAKRFRVWTCGLGGELLERLSGFLRSLDCLYESVVDYSSVDELEASLTDGTNEAPSREPLLNVVIMGETHTLINRKSPVDVKMSESAENELRMTVDSLDISPQTSLAKLETLIRDRWGNAGGLVQLVRPHTHAFLRDVTGVTQWPETTWGRCGLNGLDTNVWPLLQACLINSIESVLWTVVCQSAGERQSLSRAASPTHAAVREVRHALVVEDTLISARILTQILKQLGCTSEHAVNGAEAVKVFRQAHERGAPFDIVLMDVQMPVMSGLEATEHIRDMEVGEEWERVFIAAVTAGAKDATPVSCSGVGMDAYAEKPISKVRLTKLLALAQELRPASALGDIIVV